MNERQLTVCAIALFADGFSNVQIAEALGVDSNRAQQLTERGAEEQATGTMGHMRNCPYGKDRIVSRRGDDGRIVGTVKAIR